MGIAQIRNISMLLPALLVSVLLLSCSEKEEERENTVVASGGSIAFDVDNASRPLTRAVIDKESIKRVFVLAKKSDNDAFVSSSNVFDAVPLVLNNDASGWIYSPVKDWENKYYRFRGYFPDTSFEISDCDVVCRDYASPSNPKDADDMLVSGMVSRSPGESGTVGLSLSHILSRVSLKFISQSSNIISIFSIKLRYINKGDYHSSIGWTLHTDSKDEVSVSSFSLNELNEANAPAKMQDLLLIPQSLENVELIVSYSVGSAMFSNFSIDLSNKGRIESWDAGKAYNYKIGLHYRSVVANIAVEDWICSETTIEL